MRKLMNILLVTMLTLGIVISKPLDAYAESELINEVNVNIKTPVANDSTVLDVADRFDTSYDANYKADAIHYYDGSVELDGDATFEANKDYKAVIEVSPYVGAHFDSTTVCKLNGKAATLDATDKTCSYTFRALNETPTKKVTYNPGNTYTYTGSFDVDMSEFNLPADQKLVAYEINGVKYDDSVKYFFGEDDVTLNAITEEAFLYVEGVRVTASNANDVLGDGSVRYDSCYYTLILEDANLDTKEVVLDGFSYNTAIFSSEDLIIELIGTNTIDDKDVGTDDAYLIYAENNLEIYSRNEATLNLESDVDTFELFGIYSEGDLSLSNFNLKVSNKMSSLANVGLYSEGKAYIGDMVLLIECGKSTVPGFGTAVGIYSEDNVSISNSNVEIEMDDAVNLIGISSLEDTTVKASSLKISCTEYDGATDAVGVFTAETNLFENVLLDIQLNTKANTSVGITGTRNELINLEEGSVIKVVGADEAYALFSQNDENVIKGGLYTLIGGTTAISSGFETIETDPCVGFDVSNKTDGSEVSVWDESSDLTTYKFLKTVLKHDHSKLKSDQDNHWYECECGDALEKEKHYDQDKNWYCDLCDTKLKKEESKKPTYIVVNTAVKR